MKWPFSGANSRPPTYQNATLLLLLFIGAIVALIEKLSLDASPEEFTSSPSGGEVRDKLEKARLLCPSNTNQDTLLNDAAGAIANHIQGKVHTLWAFYENHAVLKSILDALKSGAREIIDLKKKMDEIFTQARPNRREALAAYLRLVLCALLVVLALLGEAGMIFVVWQTLLGDDTSLFIALLALSMALAAVVINELLVRVGFAVLYRYILAEIFPSAFPVSRTDTHASSQPPAPSPSREQSRAKLPTLLLFLFHSKWSLPVWFAMLHLLVNLAIVLLRREFVSEKAEGWVLVNSCSALTILSLLSHFLSEKVSSLYMSARELWKKASELRHPAFSYRDEIRRLKRMRRKSWWISLRYAFLVRKFQKARRRLHRALLRDKELASLVQIFATELARPVSEHPIPAPPSPLHSAPTATNATNGARDTSHRAPTAQPKERK